MFNKKAINLYEKGRLLQQQGKLSEAEKSYRRAIKINQDFVGAYNNLGNVLLNMGKVSKAYEVFRQADKLSPNHPLILNNIGNVLHLLGQNEKAVSQLNKAISLEPGYAYAHNNLGNALQELGRSVEACECYQKAIALEPGLHEANFNLGNVLNDLENYADAIESYKKAIGLRPDYVEAYSNLCGIYENRNQVDELKSILKKAQANLPGNEPQLLFRLAQLSNREKNYEAACDYLEQIEPQSLLQSLRATYSELLAKVYDKLGQYSNAYTQFEVTNNFASQSIGGQRVNAKNYFNNIETLIGSWSDAQIKWPVEQQVENTPALTFLIGFPRSGTTLLDTILRSHPDVEVIEEQPMVASMRKQIGELPTPEVLNSLDESHVSELREIYLKELSGYLQPDSSHKIIIDKLPLNIAYVGLIKRVFPDAKYILALRHPYDCVLSCFMQSFKLNDSMANFLSLRQSAKLYDAIMKLWSCYSDVLDVEVQAIKYESLVQDLRGTVEPLLNFLDLDWDESLLNYQQTALSRERITTPSYNQVVQKLYTSASGRWRNYSDKLETCSEFIEPWAQQFDYSTEI